MATQMTRNSSERQIFVLDAKTLFIQEKEHVSFRRHSINVVFENRKFVGKTRRLQSTDDSNIRYEFGTYPEKVGECVILEREEKGKTNLTNEFKNVVEFYLCI